VIVRFVDNDGIDDHDCLNLFSQYQRYMTPACPINYQVLTQHKLIPLHLFDISETTLFSLSSQIYGHLCV
jgi:hypothetical protein